MKIVIDISEEVYDSIKSNEGIITYVTKDGGGSKALQGSLAIINGTILPKGHGRLIDADVVDDNIYDLARNMDLNYEQISEVVDLAPTIIEAYKESD